MLRDVWKQGIEKAPVPERAQRALDQLRATKAMDFLHLRHELQSLGHASNLLLLNATRCHVVASESAISRLFLCCRSVFALCARQYGVRQQKFSARAGKISKESQCQSELLWEGGC
jgi:hypothetical protein